MSRPANEGCSTVGKLALGAGTIEHQGDGSNSAAVLIEASDGNFYGTTYGGGAYSQGTIFKIVPQ